VVPSLQQAAARKIDEGLDVTPTEEQAEVHQKNVGKMSATLR